MSSRALYSNIVKYVVTAFITLGISYCTLAQSKVNITSKMPSSIDICGKPVSAEFDLRNITTGTVSGISITVTLPTGMYYQKGSVTGSGVSEKTVTNLQKPVFSISNLAITKNATFTMDMLADCDLTGFLTNGGIPALNALSTYAGGSSTHKSLPISVNQPSINVSSITKQYHNGSLGDLFVRTISITNGGKGGIKTLSLKQTISSGLLVAGIQGGTVVKTGNIYTSSFDSSHFKQVGNKDAYLTNGETLIVTDSLIIFACTDLGASMVLSWGCNGKVCKTQTYNTQVSLINKAPNLVFTPTANVSTCFDNTVPSAEQLKIVNVGDDTARNNLVSIFQTASTGFWGGNLSSIDTASLTLKFGLNGKMQKVKIIKTRLNLNTGIRSCLGPSPIALMDIELPLMLPGDTVYLNWSSVTCCAQACIGYIYAHRWNFKATYQDQCQKTLTKAETRGSYGLYHNLSLTSFTPTDIVNDDTAKLILTVSSASLLGISANSVLDFYCELPPGVKHSLQKSDFAFRTHAGATWEPTTIKMIGDSIHAQFKGPPKVTLVRSDLIIKIIGDCSNATSNTIQTLRIDANYTPNTTCNNACVFKSLCFTTKLKVHCDNSCNSGLKFSKFDVQRISYGLPDNNNDGVPDGTGKVDLDKIRTERVMYGDTLLTVFRGKINRQGSITSWTRLTATSTIPYGRYLEVSDARVRIIRRGKQLYSCDQLKTKSSTVGNNRTFIFDLGVSNLIASSCPLYSGFSYTTTDSVELYVKYIVANNPGNFFQEVVVTSDFYLHTVASPASYQKYQCDSFSGNFQLVGSYFTSCCRGVYSANSCGEFTVSQNYYLSVGKCCSNYHGGNMFPSEYRAWAKPNKLIIIPPKGFDVVHTRLYDYRTTGTGKYKYQYEDTLTPSRQLGDTLEYDVGDLYEDKGGSFKISDDGFVGVWYVKLRPNCLAKQGSSEIGYGVEFQQLGFLGNKTERYYPTGHVDAIVYEKPQITLNTLSDEVNADSDTAVWQIVIDNASATSNSKYIWITAANNGNTTVESIIDVSTNMAVPQVNGIFQLGDLKAQKNKSYLIKATYKSCDRDSFVIHLGNDCEGYPDSLSVARCVDLQKTLYYVPQNTLLAPSIIAQDTVIDLCAFTQFEIGVKNLSNARAFNLYVDLFLQPGVILRDTAYAFLEKRTDSIMLLNPINMGGGHYRWEISKYSSYLAKEGLAGVTSNLVNEYKIKCVISTDCDFVSSTYFLTRPGGELRCGKSVLSNYTASKPFDIKGIVKPYFSYIEFVKKPIDICNYDGDGQFRFINLGPDTTGSNDFIQLLLPDGIYIDTSYLVSIYNGPKQKPTVRKGLKYTGLWEIPSGMALGDSMLFKYKTYVNPAELDCGSTQIIAQSVVLQPALCVKDSTYCDINVSTSNDLQLDSIKKGIYQLKVNAASSVASNGGEKIDLYYSITNTGSQKEAGILMQVKIIADTNGNGLPDPGEAIIARDTLLQVIGNNQTIQANIVFNAASKYVCNLLLVIDSTNCVCSQTYFSIGNIHLENAGRDTVACSRTDVVIGQPSMTGVSYTWLTDAYIDKPDSSSAVFNAVNSTTTDSEYRLLLETDRGTCKSVDTVWITLHSAMFMDLVDTMDICAGEKVIIGDVPTGGVGFKSYLWTPSDSLLSTTKIKTFANPTQTTRYKISITDSKFCTIEDSTLVAVHQIPQAKISFSDTCVGIGYSITHNSTLGDIGFDSIRYVLQNNDTFINATPGFIPTSDSLFEIQLLVIDSFGCTSSDTQYAQPYILPVADFVSNDFCQYDLVGATNLSTLKSGSLSYEWQINNNLFTTEHLSYNESNYGAFEVVLKTISDRGCTDEKLDTITLFEKPVLEVSSGNGCLGKLTNLKVKVNSATSPTITQYDWDLGDGNTMLSSGDTTYLYATEQSYTVTCIVLTSDGCLDTASTNVVINPNPQADFTIENACLGDSIILNDNSSISQGGNVLFSWNTGTGYATGGVRKPVLYTNPGLHAIQHTVTSDSGCTDTSTIQQAYLKYTEEPNLTVSGNCAESVLSFEDIAVAPDSITSVKWTLPSGTITGSTRITDLVYTVPNTYPATIELTFANGCKTDSTFMFTVDPKPVADYTWQMPCDDNLVDFTNSSTTSTGTITNVSWDLDDGNNETNFTFSHTYSTIKDYSVRLISTNSFNCLDTIIQTVSVEHLVTPDFDIADICVLDSQTVKQTIQDLITPISTIKWWMGDGITKTGLDSFDYTYINPGTYTVRMEVTTNPNCTYTTQKDVVVYDLPIPGFFMNPERADVVNSDVDFTSTAVDAVSYLYNFSNGYQSRDKDFSYRFPDTSTYSITQTVTNQYGCVDSFTGEIIIDFVVNILIPNAFHPNNDNFNNSFSPQGLGIGRFELKIFNRWGEQIFYTKDSEAWTGENAIQGSYFYMTTVYDYQNAPHYYSGVVQLLK
ncbi:MAG: PKD repeat protein [Bacteroidia bacterium]|jgi:PKD repeat protein